MIYWDRQDTLIIGYFTRHELEWLDRHPSYFHATFSNGESPRRQTRRGRADVDRDRGPARHPARTHRVVLIKDAHESWAWAWALCEYTRIPAVTLHLDWAMVSSEEPSTPVMAMRVCAPSWHGCTGSSTA